MNDFLDGLEFYHYHCVYRCRTHLYNRGFSHLLI